MSLQFHEIAEARHRILNPFTEPQLQLVGEICQPQPGWNLLDLCCGKGELLCQWAATYGIQGTGVDISPVFLAAAQQRAAELNCSQNLTFIQADAGRYEIAPNQFDIVSCIGATWIGNGLAGTLNLMRPGLRNQDSLLLVGEPYWITPPPDEAYANITSGDREIFTSLLGTLERIESTGLELVEMVLADHHGWDRYMAKQWLTVSDWLRANPTDARVGELRRWYEAERRKYLAYTRQYLGWGVFVLRDGSG